MRMKKSQVSESCLHFLIAAMLGSLLMASPVMGASAAPHIDPDIALIKQRLVAQYAAGSFSDAERFLASQRHDGSWPDINYADRSLNWAPQNHLDRLKQMAIAYQNARSASHGSAPMRDAIVRGLAFWYESKPVADNWWSNEIGKQLALEPILVLMAEDLPPQLLQAGIADLHSPAERASYQFTGENLLWSANEQLVRGILRPSRDDIAAAQSAIQSATATTAEAEGLQYDHSFHQHGPQLYVGGYGLDLLRNATANARLVQATHFADGAAQIKTLSDYLLDGARFMVRGKMLDPGAIGRETSRPGAAQEATGLLAALDDMKLLSPPQAAQYAALETHIHGTGASYGVLGHQHFWNSDFTTHERAGYYASVKMVSARTYGTETINGENLQGYWLPFGLTTIARRGDEYLDIFPVWDWTHLPGVTCPDETPRFLSHVTQPDTFVGGVSDGVYGASAMQIDIETPASLHARKAWFFFDDEFVALGTGISSTSQSEMTTTLNQSLLHGAVIEDGQVLPSGLQSPAKISWVLHDGVGYVFPEKVAVSIRTGPRHGSWQQINSLQSAAPQTKDVFALWIDHGKQPRGAGYAYIVVPDTDQAHLAAYAEHIPVHVLANTMTVQAVAHEGLGVSEIIFHAAGRFALAQDMAISVDQPCMLLLRNMGSVTELAASAPRGPIQLHVMLEHAGKTKAASFNLRGGPSLGASQIQKISWS